MKYIVNNITRDASQEELAAWEQFIADTPPQEPTQEERIEALEEQLAAAKILLGLED